jgi:hypothetical protein
MLSIDWICKHSPAFWEYESGPSFYTRFIHQHTEELERLLPEPGDFKEYTWKEVTNELIINKMIKRPDSLFGIEIWSDYFDDIPKVCYYYRYKRSEFRMMQLLAEPPVPKDILRHIYEFIKK